MRTNKRSKFGFTIVELLAALLLSSMLLVALMGVTARMSQSVQKLQQKYERDSWLAPVVAQVEHDFMNSRAVIVEPTRVLFSGYCFSITDGSQPEFAGRHLPLAIEYRVAEIKSESWLVRTEIHIGVAPPNNEFSELVCQGVVGFHAFQKLETDVTPAVLAIGLETANAVGDTKIRRFNFLRSLEESL